MTTPKNPAEPREWWIYDNGEWFGSLVSESPVDREDFHSQKAFDEVIHVVEISALEQVRAEIERLTTSNKFVYDEATRRLEGWSKALGEAERLEVMAESYRAKLANLVNGIDYDNGGRTLSTSTYAYFEEAREVLKEVK